MKTKYKHSFSKSGIYLGKQKVTLMDYIHQYMWIVGILGFLISIWYISTQLTISTVNL